MLIPSRINGDIIHRLADSTSEQSWLQSLWILLSSSSNTLMPRAKISSIFSQCGQPISSSHEKVVCGTLSPRTCHCGVPTYWRYRHQPAWPVEWVSHGGPSMYQQKIVGLAPKYLGYLDFLPQYIFQVTVTSARNDHSSLPMGVRCIHLDTSPPRRPASLPIQPGWPFHNHKPEQTELCLFSSGLLFLCLLLSCLALPPATSSRFCFSGGHSLGVILSVH